MFCGKKSDLTYFYILGCIAYVYMPKEFRYKFHVKADK